MAALATAVCLLVAFYRWAQAQGDAALIDMRLLRGHGFSASLGTMFMLNGVAFGLLSLLQLLLFLATLRLPWTAQHRDP